MTRTQRAQTAGRRTLSAAEQSRAKHLTELEMQARYHRDRHRLYAARMGGSRPFSLSKLRGLKRMREVAESALSRAKDDNRAASPGDVARPTSQRVEHQLDPDSDRLRRTRPKRLESKP